MDGAEPDTAAVDSRVALKKAGQILPLPLLARQIYSARNAAHSTLGRPATEGTRAWTALRERVDCMVFPIATSKKWQVLGGGGGLG